ncbi:MAG: phytanoyl-CoA dioxygenase family protein [Kordiimonadaceae bacterium]|nr:phytanoyl-CoA dioxygenase family protein [Kordiimonadaceae bacterium]
MIIASASPYSDSGTLFNKDGAVVLQGFFLEEEIATMQQAILAAFSVETVADLHAAVGAMDQDDQAGLYMRYQCIGRSIALLALVTKIGAYYAKQHGNAQVALMDANVLFGLPRDERLAHDWHQEEPYYPGLNNDVITFWFPVMEAASPEIGTMSILEGSHTEGLLPYHRDQKSGGLTELVPKNISEIEPCYPVYSCDLELGDVFMFHQHTIHRSNWNASPRTRFSGSIRFAHMKALPDRLTDFCSAYSDGPAEGCGE